LKTKTLQKFSSARRNCPQ